MIKPTKNISEIKKMVRACASEHVAVRVNLGRNKSVSYSGILSGVYPALFTVKPDDKDFLGKTDGDIIEFVNDNPIPTDDDKNECVAKKLANMQRKIRNEKYDEEERGESETLIELIDDLNR